MKIDDVNPKDRIILLARKKDDKYQGLNAVAVVIEGVHQNIVGVERGLDVELDGVIIPYDVANRVFGYVSDGSDRNILLDAMKLFVKRDRNK
jgi:hypothetical protein